MNRLRIPTQALTSFCHWRAAAWMPWSWQGQVAVRRSGSEMEICGNRINLLIKMGVEKGAPSVRWMITIISPLSRHASQRLPQHSSAYKSSCWTPLHAEGRGVELLERMHCGDCRLNAATRGEMGEDLASSDSCRSQLLLQRKPASRVPNS